MADQYDAPEPFIGTKFWIEIDGVAVAYFTECSGLNAETETTEYAEGGVNDYVHKLPVRTKFTNVTLKRGWVSTDELWTWYKNVVDGKVQRRSVSIILYENRVTGTAKERGRWNLQGAYPVKWQGPTFKADSDTVAVESLELAHNRWDRS